MSNTLENMDGMKGNIMVLNTKSNNLFALYRIFITYLHQQMTQVRIHMEPKSLLSQCDYRGIVANFWTRLGRYVSIFERF